MTRSFHWRPFGDADGLNNAFDPPDVFADWNNGGDFVANTFIGIHFHCAWCQWTRQPHQRTRALGR